MALLPRAAPARHAQRLLCSLFLCLSLSTLLARAATRRHEWEVSYQFKSPDCVRKLSATINGQTPGPTIRATQGDTVEVKVTNSLLTENLAIHWHGIRQIGTPWADGTEGVTQCPILPGDTFTYTFVVDRPGTYMYHAHYGMQRSAGLYGVIVVAVAEDPGGEVDGAEPFAYDDEHDVLLNDWWHSSTHEQAVGLASVPMVWVGEPHSLLINGRGRFDCSAAAVPGTCNATSPECAAPVFAVVPGKTYRFRIASVTSLSALNFEIEVHARAFALISRNLFVYFPVDLFLQISYFRILAFSRHCPEEAITVMKHHVLSKRCLIRITPKTVYHTKYILSSHKCNNFNPKQHMYAILKTLCFDKNNL